MKLLLLGTGGYHPSNERQTACLMLPELGVILDAGSAFFRVREHLETDTLDIFLSHAHFDHVIGLTYLFDVLGQREATRVTVHADADILATIDEHLFAEALFPAKPPFQTQTLAAETELPGAGRLTHFPLEHPGGSRGFRLDWPDSSMAYVTDTTARADSDYIEPIRGVDLLVHECHFRDDMTDQAKLTGHSCTTPVAQLAATAGVGRLLLVHVNPMAEGPDPIDLKAARSIFPQTELGCDQMEIDF